MKTCEQCGKEFSRPKRLGFKLWEKRKFCSQTCSYNSKKGKQPAWFPKTPWNKGKKLHYKVHNKGKKIDEWMTEESQKRFREAPRPSGKNHHKWKGGKVSWARSQALKRDDYTCQHCGLRQPEIMEGAHKKPIQGKDNRYSKLHTPEDFITLCPNCHRLFDKNVR